MQVAAVRPARADRRQISLRSRQSLQVLTLATQSNSDVISGLVAGGVVALLAFALAVLWDLLKFRRDRGARQKSALAGYKEEMTANREAAGNSLTLIAVEDRDLAGRSAKALLNPLSSLETGAWTVARLDLPNELLEDHDLVRRLQIIHRNTTDINSLIQSRENFRIEHLGDDELLVEGLRKYGSVLSHLLRDLQARINEAMRELERYTR